MEEQDNNHRIMAGMADGKGSDSRCWWLLRPAFPVVFAWKVCRTAISSPLLPCRYEVPAGYFRSSHVPYVPVCAQEDPRVTYGMCPLAGTILSVVRMCDHWSDFWTTSGLVDRLITPAGGHASGPVVGG